VGLHPDVPEGLPGVHDQVEGLAGLRQALGGLQEMEELPRGVGVQPFVQAEGVERTHQQEEVAPWGDGCVGSASGRLGVGGYPHGGSAELELEIRNRLHPSSTKGYNVVAEIPGTEKPEEVVLLGAHLDSWHTATGATDDGASCVAMMEALRILKAVGAKPRRTIRIVLFDAEEQGLLGSQAYVKAHYGSDQAPLPEYKNLVAFFNSKHSAGAARQFRAGVISTGGMRC